MTLFRQQKLGEVTQWLHIWYVKYLWSSAFSACFKSPIYNIAGEIHSWYADDVFQTGV